VLLDNKGQARVFDALSRAMVPDANASLLTSDFSVFAWDALRTSLARLARTRLLLATGGQESPAIGGQLLGGPDERRFRNALTAPGIARQVDRWLTRGAEVRATRVIMPSSVFHLQQPSGPATAVQGSSAFNAPGLGLAPSERMDMNFLVQDPTATAGLLTFFDELWFSPTKTREGKDELRDRLRAIYQPAPPQTVYFLRATERAKIDCGEAHFEAMRTEMGFHKAHNIGALHDVVG
jgi:hypothetical protein